MRVGALIPAAGYGRRFGSDKRYARLPSGAIILEQTLGAVLTVLGDCRVVLRREDAALARRLEQQGAQCILLPRSSGMGSSIAQGLNPLPDWDACLVLPGDMPFVRPETIAGIARAAASHTAVVPLCGGRCGHPVAFQRSCFPALGALRGNAGARRLLARQNPYPWSTTDSGVLWDVDEPAALLRPPAGGGWRA